MVQGGIDAYLGMLGLGADGAGDLAVILGSSACHLPMAPVPVFGSGLLGRHLTSSESIPLGPNGGECSG